MQKEEVLDLLSLCGEGGCAAKLPAGELESLLQGMNWNTTAQVLVGLETGDDAGVYLLSEREGLILTTDFFPPFCSDAKFYGEVAAVNALSDIYAMGGVAIAALNITMFPTDMAYRPLLRQILEGGADVARRAGIPIIGGHTIANATPVYGLAVLGRVAPSMLITNDRLEVGQSLLLTKPLGIGITMAASRLHIAPDVLYDKAKHAMRTLNRDTVDIMHKFGVRAATDITGFSLVGHAYKMARASQVAIELWGETLPVLPGVRELVDLGCIPGAVFSNRASVEKYCAISKALPRWLQTLVYDPQTSGGILMAVDPLYAQELLAELQAVGYTYTTVVGKVIEPTNDSLVRVV